jgi:CBS domain-containing protein
MASQIGDLMATDVATIDPHATLREAARLMRDKDIGDVIITDGSTPRGILTDRDIAIRAVADSRRDPVATEVGEIASTSLQTLSPSDSIDDAVALMRDAAVRRAPVLDDGAVVGVVSLGDLARERDRESALGRISTAPANH